jgi:DNA-binding NarL/FixJ family response regulator
MIKVVLADDQLLIRQGIRGLLGLTGDIEVVGEASDGLEAVDVVMRTHPDVGLFDVRMPGGSGIEALKELRKRKIDLKVILLTTFNDDQAFDEGIKEGIKGWQLKDVSLDDLAAAIRTVAAGGTAIMSIPAGPYEEVEDTEFPKNDLPSELTARELEVLRFIAKGMSNREIADALGTAEGTVKNQASSILQKLGVRDRTQAVLRAAELRLL